MAKGARASSKKAKRTKLRASVFGPVEQARAERLHAKLVEAIAQPRPEKTEMDTEDTNPTDEATKEDLPKDMDVDGTTTPAKNSRKNKDKSQTRKQLRRRPQNKVTFPASRGKGALKPFTGGRTGGRVAKRTS